MYGSYHGPFMLPQGESTIYSQLHVDTRMKANTTTSFVVYGVYDSSFKYKEDPLIGLCGTDPTVDITDNFWASKVYVERVPLQFAGKALPTSGAFANELDDFDEDQRIYRFTADIEVSYKVKVEGWYNVVMELCEDDTTTNSAPNVAALAAIGTAHTNDPAIGTGTDTNVESDDDSNMLMMDVMTISGDISFKNPYGYLPASLCGLLPFQATLLVAYIGTTVGFSWYFSKYYESAVSIHYGVLAVLAIAVGESLCWLLAYIYINATGTPYCCPFPVVIVTSLIFQILRQAVSRCLLLVISLGYGIVRPKLSRFEWLGITMITCMYFIAATVGQVFDIEIRRKLSMGSDSDSSSATDAENALYVYFAEIVVDSFYITWIAFALGATIKELQDYQQTYKLELYNRLYSAIYVFLLVFAVITALILLNRNGIIAWPWQLEWLPVVLWPTFNYAVLATICVICTPSDSSRYLAYSSQLPTFDPDSSVDEFNDSIGTAEAEAEEEGDDDEDVLSGHHNQQRYDAMTPPVARLMYKQQHSHGKTPTSDRLATSLQNRSKSDRNTHNDTTNIHNPILHRENGDSDSVGAEQEAAMDITKLSYDEKEFEMVMRGNTGSGRE